MVERILMEGFHFLQQVTQELAPKLPVIFRHPVKGVIFQHAGD